MPWKLGSGLRTDYELHIQQAYFAPDATYLNGEALLLHLVGVDENGEESTEKYSIGRDWISTDGGKTCKTSHGGVTISRSSMYGHFITAVTLLDDESGGGTVFLKEMADRGEANEAKVWPGCVFYLSEQEISFGRGLDPVYRNMPIRFLGFEGNGVVADPVAVAKPKVREITEQTFPTPNPLAAALKAKATPTPKPVFASEHMGDYISAASSDTFEEYVDLIGNVPGVGEEDEEFINHLVDPEPSGFYTLHHGS